MTLFFSVAPFGEVKAGALGVPKLDLAPVETGAQDNRQEGTAETPETKEGADFGMETGQSEEESSDSLPAAAAQDPLVQELLKRMEEGGRISPWEREVTAEPMEADADEAERRIPEGLSIEGTSVGGMTVPEAGEVVSDYVASFSDAVFTLSAEDREVTATAGALGLCARNADLAKRVCAYGTEGNLLSRFREKRAIDSGEAADFSVLLGTDTDTTIAWLSSRAADLDRAPVEHQLVRENGSFSIIDGSDGLEVDTQAAAALIGETIAGDWRGEDVALVLPTRVSHPKGDRAQLETVGDLMGSFSTNFTSWSAARNTNITTATACINGTVVLPGEVFSAYAAMSPMDEDHGYVYGSAYENGTVVDSIGGGVCQVSTTLYNAVIRAELDVVERYAHSLTVDYIKPSEDAAIAGGYKDFKFRNSSDYPVYLEGYLTSGGVTFNVYGKETRPENRSVRFESEVVSEESYQVRYEMSDAYAAGSVQRTQSAHTGYVARLWKIVSEDGVETERGVFNNSHYLATDAVITVGTQGMSQTGRNAIASAIATGNDATIRNTAAQYTAAQESWRAQQAAQQAQAAQQQAAQQTAEEAQSAAGGAASGTEDAPAQPGAGQETE